MTHKITLTLLAIIFVGTAVYLKMGQADAVQSTPQNPAAQLAEMTTSSGSHDMSPRNYKDIEASPIAKMGGTDLPSKLLKEKSGDVRVFNLTIDKVRWSILPNVTVSGYGYNGQIPGPVIRGNVGERIRIIAQNNLSEPTTIHWHGLDIPADMDGGHDQMIAAGASKTYEFILPEKAGTYWYHSHMNADVQQGLGLYGALIVDDPDRPLDVTQDIPIVLSEWKITDSGTLPAMPMEGMFPNYFTLNGKAYPATQVIHAKVGDHLLFRLIGAGSFTHPIHIHGGPFDVIATDGHELPDEAKYKKDTIAVSPGERYDIVWTASRPGTWLLHCHINHHTTNGNNEASDDDMGGMVMKIMVEG